MLRRALRGRLLNAGSLPALRDLLPSNLIPSRSKASAAPAEPAAEQLTSRTKRDNKIRFFVINNRPSDAVDLLERSLSRTPIVDAAAQKLRYLKLPPASVCNKVLDSAAQTREPDLVLRAADLAGALQLEGVAVEARTAQSLVGALAASGAVDRGIQLLDGWLASNADLLEDDAAAEGGPLGVATALLEAAARADDPDAVSQVLLRMARTGLSPPLHTMTAIIQCYARLGHIDTAHAILGWMRRAEMEVTAHAYAALMTLPLSLSPALGRSFMAKSKAAYAEMKAAGVPPTAHFYAAYIAACGRLRELEAARDAWLDMEESEVEPDLILYSAMIDACAKGGDTAGAFHLYDEMRDRGVEPDGVAYATLLAAAAGGAPDRARRLWAEMAAGGVVPDARAARIYLDNLLRGGETHAALKLLRDAASPALYEAAAEAAGARLQARLLRELVAQAQEVGVGVTAGMWGSLLNARARKARGGAARWRLPPDDADAGRPLAGGDAVVESLLAALDSSAEEGAAAAERAGEAAALGTPADAAAAAAWLSAEGLEERALAVYESAAEGMDRSTRAWALRALMAGALAAPGAGQVPLLLAVVADARRWSAAGSGWWFDGRTQKQVTRLLRGAPQVAELLGGGDAEDGVDARVRRLVRR